MGGDITGCLTSALSWCSFVTCYVCQCVALKNPIWGGKFVDRGSSGRENNWVGKNKRKNFDECYSLVSSLIVATYVQA